MSSSMQPFPSDAKPQEANAEGETNPELYRHYTKLVSGFPSSNGITNLPLYHHPKGWNSSLVSMVGSMVADSCFTARPSDIIVTTPPKSGTTWMKSLLYTTVHRKQHPVDSADHPLKSIGPHECINFFEYQLYTKNKIPSLDNLLEPRLFATHVPFVSLPRTIAGSGCKIVFVCRDPKDNLISLWDFVNKFRVKQGHEPISLEAAAELFCNGLSPFGPYWDHVLGYWRAHLAHPEKVLFFRYEEMHKEPAAHVRRLAEFVGFPFSAGEEEAGVVDAVVRLCSFEHMGGLVATKRGKTEFVFGVMENSLFLRRGVVGDWENHMSPEIARRIDTITQAKFKGTGLSV
ncbi:hypothetical protein PR202_gb14944 [Eleusine coracana subsp. coracana]|uniref:Sulfotransferase n=1 Tax=Eleusine coracana subsp. coracana TaxID=191504 RepID=A0AAV5EWQ2_ELECO|nr:hypothetical protein QOZ80_4BG0341100 [Eleusine coracana subsp. coracana]GJN26974.1 hypothetical protein PR202_gb14944 [Eleusine coracana subsp. coracana]